MARPTKKAQLSKKLSEAKQKFNDDIIRKLEQAFALDCTIEEACLYAGIGKSTYYDNLPKNKGLAERFEALRNTPVLKARQSVIKSFDSDPNLALKYLERKRRAEFSVRQELTGADGNELLTKLEVNIINKHVDEVDLNTIDADTIINKGISNDNTIQSD